MTAEIGPRSPFSHGWYATTAASSFWIWGILALKRATTAIIGLLLLAGCSADVKIPEQPAMYLDMAQPGATLDPVAAAIMISQYRQNNGLGTRGGRSRTDQARRAAVAGDGGAQQDGPQREGRRWTSGWGPPAIRRRSRSKTSRPATTPWRKPFPAGATRRRTRPICSKTVSQNWASRRAYAPNTKYKVFWTLILAST